MLRFLLCISEIGCKAPKAPANMVITGTDFTFGAKVTYSCKSGYTHATGDLVRTCGSDKKWTDTEPACKSKHSLLFDISLADCKRTTNSCFSGNLPYILYISGHDF